MAIAIHRPHITLNTDGKRHPLENSLTVATVGCAIVSLVCIPFVSLHVLASWFAIAGIAIGLRAQLVSATRGERAINVVAIGAAAYGLAFGLVHGGLY
jgi:hypothetical protein